MLRKTSKKKESEKKERKTDRQTKIQNKILNDITTSCASKDDGDTDVPFVFLLTNAENIAR